MLLAIMITNPSLVDHRQAVMDGLEKKSTKIQSGTQISSPIVSTGASDTALTR